MKVYKIKNSIDLFKILPTFGYEYIGNYNRGDNWLKTISGIDEMEPVNVIVIHGDWDSRRLDFRFPYRGTIENLDILTFIPELLEANFVEEDGGPNE